MLRPHLDAASAPITEDAGFILSATRGDGARLVFYINRPKRGNSRSVFNIERKS